MRISDWSSDVCSADLIAWNVYPKRFEVTRVVDGDSLEVRRGNRQLRVRIKHFDAPEYHQDGGREARIYLAQLLKGRPLRMGLYENDAYDRALGRCYIGWTPDDWLMTPGGHARSEERRVWKKGGGTVRTGG